MSFYEVTEIASDLFYVLDSTEVRTSHPPSMPQIHVRTGLDGEPHPPSPSLRRALPPATPLPAAGA